MVDASMSAFYIITSNKLVPCILTGMFMEKHVIRATSINKYRVNLVAKLNYTLVFKTAINANRKFLIFLFKASPVQ